jgi:hypothetical protein
MGITIDGPIATLSWNDVDMCAFYIHTLIEGDMPSVAASYMRPLMEALQALSNDSDAIMIKD